MNIGERILKLRKEAHLSQEEVAEKLNVTRQTISKWETGDSTPDFDKILPLCELFNISTDELIKGSKKDNEVINENNNKEYKKKTAKVLAVSIFLYFISIIWLIAFESTNIISEELLVCVFLFICAVPTCMIVYHFVSNSNDEKKEETKESDDEENPKYKKIDSILALIFLIIYLSVSFITSRWDITWIIWIIYALISEIAHLIIDMKSGE